VKKVELGEAGECIAEIFLKRRGFNVWRPDDFIRMLELAAVYETIDGTCEEEPREPLMFSVSTRAGYVHVTYWRGRCPPLEGREAAPLERALYLPCLKRCIEEALGEQLLKALRPIAAVLLEYRRVLKSVDLFAFKDGVVYAVEVKTNSGKLSERQVEKTEVLKLIKHVLVQVHLQNPLVEINQL